MKRKTIADVANLAGVSISTVSYALSNKRPISDRTRRKIQSAIEKLGYRPNSNAIRLASHEATRNIGFVLPLRGSEMTGLELQFIAGAAREINQANYTFVLLAHSDRNPDNLLRIARSGVVDGIILMEIFMHDERVDLLRDEGIPFVMIGRCADNTGLLFVDLDIKKGMEQCFRYFLDLGRDRIALIHSGESQLGLAVRSVREYQAGCRRHKITPRMQICSMAVEDGERAMNAILDADPAVKVAIVWNEIPAMGVARAVQARGRSIPEDFSLVCLAQSSATNLSTLSPAIINIRPYEIAALAAKMMIDKLEGHPIEQPQLLLEPLLQTGTGSAGS